SQNPQWTYSLSNRLDSCPPPQNLLLTWLLSLRSSIAAIIYHPCSNSPIDHIPCSETQAHNCFLYLPSTPDPCRKKQGWNKGNFCHRTLCNLLSLPNLDGVKIPQ